MSQQRSCLASQKGGELPGLGNLLGSVLTGTLWPLSRELDQRVVVDFCPKPEIEGTLILTRLCEACLRFDLDEAPFLV